MILDSSLSFTLNDPCGRLHCGKGWGRERDTSLRLPDLELWLVWKGKGWMKTATRELRLLPGFCAIMRPGGIYDAGQDEKNPLGITYIHFDAGAPSRTRNRTPQWKSWPEFFDVDDLDYFDAVTRRIVQLFPKDPKLGGRLLGGLLEDLLKRPTLAESTASPTASPTQERQILQMTARLRSSGDPLPTVSGMARELHVSTAHFSRLFRKVTGQAPRDFILENRLLRARHLLRETPLSVKEIAERLDYSDIFFFSRQFKAKTGMSPLAYRRG